MSAASMLAATPTFPDTACSCSFFKMPRAIAFVLPTSFSKPDTSNNTPSANISTRYAKPYAMDSNASSSRFTSGEMMQANNLDIAVIELDLCPERRAKEMFTRAQIDIQLAQQLKTPAAGPHRAPPLKLKRLLRGRTGYRIFGRDDKQRRRFLNAVS